MLDFYLPLHDNFALSYTSLDLEQNILSDQHGFMYSKV